MRIALLLLYLLVCLIDLSGQKKQDYQTLFYQINAAEYSQLQEGQKLDSSYLHTQLDTSIKKINYGRYGYFIQIYPKQEELQFNVIANTSISIIPLNNQKDFALRVIDSMGVPLSTAEVYWDNKIIPYHAKTQSYRLRKWEKKGGHLKVLANGEVLYYKIIKANNHYKQKKTLGTRLKAPIRWTKYSWWKLKRWVEEGGFWAPYDREYKGYIAFNQPKYRPNDTLKIKAFLANKRGKPLKKALELNISGGKGQFKKMVTPTTAGNYTANVVLHDSLNFGLDRNCRVWFYDQRPSDYFEVKSHSFYLEDYQLDDIVYNLKTDKETYEYGEKISVQATGKFKTGQYIPDGSVRLVVRTNFSSQYLLNSDFFDKEVLVKDTIWATEESLSSQKPTQILIPKDSLPKAELKYHVDATFYNSNGEIQKKQVSFEIKEPDTSHLKIDLDGAYVIASLKDTTKTAKVEWTTYNDERDTEGTKIVTLPHREKINGNLTDYDVTIKDGKDYVDLYLEDFPDLVQISGQHTGQKLNIQINNPRLLKINYQLFKSKKLIEEGTLNQENINLGFKANANKTYYLRYQYVWAGIEKTQSTPYVYYKNQLQISVDQPSAIVPGEAVPIKIAVKNQKGQKVSGVDLTAGAINGKFDNKNNFSTINVPYKFSKSPKTRQKFHYNEMDDPVQKAWAMTKDWAVKTAVDSQLFYQLRFPESGIYMRYDSIVKDSFYQDIAQFAPYLIKKGKAQPIYLIYCNRKLVYYFDVQDDPPYAFIGESGYNNLQIRTREFTYYLDSVFLKKGQKLELSVDLDRYDKAELPFKIRKEPTQGLLTPFEKSVLQKTIFVLQPTKGRHHLSQGIQNIHIFSNNHRSSTNRITQIGPFYPNGNLHYILRDQFSNIFKFESGFKYQISPNRERLYEYDILKKMLFLPFDLPLQKTGQTVYSPADIQLFSPEKKSINFHNMRGRKLKKKSTLLFKTQKDSLLAILWQSRDSTNYTLSPSTDKIKDNAGTYRLIFVKKDSSYAIKKVALTVNDLLFLDLTKLIFRRDSTQAIFDQIAYKITRPKNELGLLFNNDNTPDPPMLLPDGPSRFIEGTLTDSTGESLIGASVLLKGTAHGTVTDIDGRYFLEVPYGDYELVFSYTGFATQEVVGNSNSSVVDVVLSEGVELSEVVVTGLSVKKAKNSVAYASVASSSILSGKASGVTVIGRRDDPKERQQELAILPEGIQLRSNFQDCAFWQPNLITDQDGMAYFTAQFPDNLTQWETFVIGMDKKQRAGVAFAQTNAFKPLVAQLNTPRFLIERDSVGIIGKSINFTNDSLIISTLFKNNGQIIATNSAIISDALIEKIIVSPLPHQDTLQLIYQLTNEGYGDGEKRPIPIFKKGIIENKGVFHLLDTDTTIQLAFSDKNNPVKLRVEGNIFDLLTKDINYLINYPHGCNEQTASKLMATLLGKQLKKIQGEPFEKEKYIRKGIKRLEDSQNVDGSWGWWKNGQANIWMTAYVLKALDQAENAGYKSQAKNKGLIYLTQKLEQVTGRGLLNILELLTDFQQNTAYESYLTKVDTSIKIKNLNEKLTILKIKQANNLAYSLDTLFKYQQQDIFGNHYWGKVNYHWYDTDIQNSLLAYEILQKAGSTQICRSIERYLLRQKTLIGWTNTFQTAKVLTTILSNNFDKNKGKSEEDLLILEQETQQIIRQFPYETELSAQTPIKLTRQGNQPFYVTAYQTFFNQNPSPKTGLFNITTALQQANIPVKNLKATQPTQLIVTVQVERKADYVMIEVPIPAGCSYGDKERSYQSWWRSNGNREVHRAYHKEKVNIFCESMPKGTYTYTINLEPRYSGTYTLNPAKAEEMYFPIFYGRNEGKRVEINN